MAEAENGEEVPPIRQVEEVTLNTGVEITVIFFKYAGEERKQFAAASLEGGIGLLLPGRQDFVQVQHRGDPSTFMCAMLVSMLHSPNKQFQELTFASNDGDQEELDKNFGAFQDLMPNYIHHQLEVKKLSFHYFPVTQSQILKVLPFLKPGYLEKLHIYLEDPNDPLELDVVARSEQWLQLKQFRTTEVLLSSNVEAFDHFEEVDIYIANDWGVEEVDHMVQNFRNRHPKDRLIKGDFIRNKQQLINDYFNQYRDFNKGGNRRQILMGRKYLTITMTENTIHLVRI